MKHFLGIVAICLACLITPPATHAQSAPASLPGFSVQTFVGYTAVQGQQSGNGMFTSIAVPLHTVNTKYSFTTSARLDNFLLLNPNQNVILAGPEERFQFSSANFLDGQVFQPFVNFEFGASRAACVATATCGAGVSTSTSFAYKVGGGLDIITSAHTTFRMLEVDRIQLTSGPVLIGNTNQFVTGIGFRF